MKKLFTLIAALICATGMWAMEVTINLPDASTKTLEVEPSDSYEYVKSKIEDRTDIPVTQQEIYYKGVLKADDRTLSQDGITTSGAQLDCKVIAAANFQDFEINLLTNADLGGDSNTGGSKYMVNVAGVKQYFYATAPTKYNAFFEFEKFNGTQHGYTNLTIAIPVKAGNYRVTLGGCQYGSGNGTVKNEDKSSTLASFNQKTAACYDNDANVAVATFSVATDQTIHVTCGNFTPYFKIEKLTDTKYTITFAAGEGAGIVPAAKQVVAGNTTALPANFSLYKDGYTLTGWNDGESTHDIGYLYEPTADITLTAVYSLNTVSLNDRSTAVTIKWLFSQSDGVPAINVSGGTTFVVMQASVAGQTIDVQLPIDAMVGKFVNSSNSWTQINPGVIFTIPSAKEAVITYKQYDNGAITTPVINVDASDATYALTAAGTSGQLYYEYIQVALPAPDPTAVDETNANTKATKRIKDSQLLIEHNGRIYDATGRRIK